MYEVRFNRPFATNDHRVQNIRHAGGQAHYYSRTGTLNRDVNQLSVTGLVHGKPTGKLLD